jgi:small subunit ribosomal protein S9
MAKYYEGIGRRKTSTCRVRISKGDGKITVNKEKFKDYFSDFEDRNYIVKSVLEKIDKQNDFNVSVMVRGGGKRSQLESVQLGLARALVEYSTDLKPTLKQEGYLTRDPRMKERKKPGRKRARKGSQWVKR